MRLERRGKNPVQRCICGGNASGKSLLVRRPSFSTSQGKVFDYGFSYILSRFVVTSEWLVDLNGSPKTLFSRDGNSIEVGKQLKSRLSDDERARTRIYSEDFLELDFGEHDLFLSFIGRGKAMAPDSPFQDLVKAFAWLDDACFRGKARRKRSFIVTGAPD